MFGCDIDVSKLEPCAPDFSRDKRLNNYRGACSIWFNQDNLHFKNGAKVAAYLKDLMQHLMEVAKKRSLDLFETPSFDTNKDQYGFVKDLFVKYGSKEYPILKFSDIQIQYEKGKYQIYFDLVSSVGFLLSFKGGFIEKDKMPDKFKGIATISRIIKLDDLEFLL